MIIRLHSDSSVGRPLLSALLIEVRLFIFFQHPALSMLYLVNVNQGGIYIFTFINCRTNILSKKFSAKLMVVLFNVNPLKNQELFDSEQWSVSVRSDLFMISLPGGRFQMLKFCSVNKDKFSSQNFFSVFARRLRNCATSYEVSRSVAISVQRCSTASLVIGQTGLGLNIPLFICYSEKDDVDSSVFTVRQSMKNWMSVLDENFRISGISFR